MEVITIPGEAIIQKVVELGIVGMAVFALIMVVVGGVVGLIILNRMTKSQNVLYEKTATRDNQTIADLSTTNKRLADTLESKNVVDAQMADSLAKLADALNKNTEAVTHTSKQQVDFSKLINDTLAAFSGEQSRGNRLLETLNTQLSDLLKMIPENQQELKSLLEGFKVGVEHKITDEIQIVPKEGAA